MLEPSLHRLYFRSYSVHIKMFIPGVSEFGTWPKRNPGNGMGLLMIPAALSFNTEWCVCGIQGECMRLEVYVWVSFYKYCMWNSLLYCSTLSLNAWFPSSFLT